MSIKQYTGSSLLNGLTEAAIALEVAGGSRVAFSAVQPSGELIGSMSYRWQADNRAVIVAPDKADTEVIMPVVTVATRVNLTLVVTNGSGVSARNSWPIVVTPAKNDAPDSDDTGKDDTGKDDTGKDDTGKDDTGKDDTGGAKYPQWSAAVPYPGGSQVSHKGGNYQAKWWVVAGTEPGLVTTTGPATGNSLPWMPI